MPATYTSSTPLLTGVIDMSIVVAAVELANVCTATSSGTVPSMPSWKDAPQIDRLPDEEVNEIEASPPAAFLCTTNMVALSFVDCARKSLV